MTAEKNLPLEYTNEEMARLAELLKLIPLEGIAWFGSPMKYTREGFANFIPRVYRLTPPFKDPRQALYAINDSLIGWGLNQPGSEKRSYSVEERTPALVIFRPLWEADTARLSQHPFEIFNPNLYKRVGMISIAIDEEYSPDLAVHRRMVNTAIDEMINLLRVPQPTSSAGPQQLPEAK